MGWARDACHAVRRFGTLIQAEVTGYGLVVLQSLGVSRLKLLGYRQIDMTWLGSAGTIAITDAAQSGLGS